MINITEIFFGSLLVAFTGALMPGPMLTLVITSVAQKGFRTSVFIVAGHSILELAIVAGFYFGILKYLENPLIVKTISIVGGIFLVYLAVSTAISVIRNKNNIDFKKLSINIALDKKSTIVLVLKGILISLSNPYWYIWWLTIGAAFMVRSINYRFAGVGAFYTGHILADFIWYLTVAFLISSGRRFFNKKIYNGILIACSIFLFYLGIRFIIGFINN